jgi:hypothetical protein
MASGDFVLFRNTPIVDAATSNTTSQVGEPSVATNGQCVLLTGNWYASFSSDSGTTWSYVDPYHMFPSANSGFCCDQVALYDPSRDLVFWLLQYSADANRNTLRLAISKGLDNFQNNRWYWYDFSPDSVNAAWTQQWFDFPDLALSRNFLYVTSNMFNLGESGGWTRSIVLRLSLDQLAAGTGLNYNYFQTSDNFSLRCTQGAQDTMYFGSHNSTSQLRVFSWPESAGGPVQNDVDVTLWSETGYSGPGPDGRDWLGRADGRITGAYVAQGVIGFLWTSAQIAGARPFPFARHVRINESTKALINQPDVWHPNFAWAYPTAGVNDRAHLGLAAFYGGGTLNPSHAVGLLDDLNATTGLAWLTTVSGSSGPDANKWGDYLACRRHAGDGVTWVATGFSEQGGADQASIEPRFIHFGRRRDGGT